MVLGLIGTVLSGMVAVILAGPFRYLLGVVRPLPFSGRYFEVRYSTSVGWFENMVESLVGFVSVLAFD